MTIRITESDGRPWRLTLRIPGWANGSEVVDPSGARRAAGPGTTSIEWPYAVGDELTLTMPITPRWTTPDPRIDAVRGCVALERGPIVMCAESVDLPDGRDVDLLLVDPTVAPRDEGTAVVVAARFLDVVDHAWPYVHDPTTAHDAAGTAPTDVRLRPYSGWANRGPSTMRVWLPAETG